MAIDLPLLLYIAKSMTAAERESADAYAGPDKSFPMYTSGKHLKAAWNLAGHAADPSAVRARILAFARKHNLMDKLPATATEAKKAEGENSPENDIGIEPGYAANIEEHDDDGDTLETLLGVSSDHDAEDIKLLLQDWAEIYGLQVVSKALPEIEMELPVSKSMAIQKAWTDDDGTTHIEGWISTEAQDIQKDIVPPEAFKGAVGGYMSMGGPLTSEHQLKPTGQNLTRYPIGHMQQVALVRDGQIIESGSHPTDPADFSFFPQSGTGVYGRGVIDDPLASSQVAKGNVRGFSWVGIVRTAVKLPGGGMRFTKIDPWRESTISAFPVNPTAIITAAN